MKTKAWIKILAGSDVVVITVGVAVACVASSHDLAQFSARNKVNIHGVSHNVFFQGTLQIKADANFAVNDFAWTLPYSLEDIQFTVSGEHNEVLNIANQNQTDQKVIFDIKVSSGIYDSSLYKINCFVDPAKRQEPVTNDEQNPNYTVADNSRLIVKLTDYLDLHLPSYPIDNLQQIFDNAYLTEEEKYHKIQEELLKQDVKLVDHVVLEEEINDIKQSQDAKIQTLAELNPQQKDQLINDVHNLFDEYQHQAVNNVLVAEELYDNTINFIENTDKIPEEQKVQMDADLLLEAFIENNTPTVIEKALPFDELVEKITTEFSIDNTELLGSVLTTKNGEQFDQNVVSDKFILLSKITSFDIASFTINIQYALGQVNQDGLLTIYEREEPIECSYVLQPSLKLDQQQMLDWFNSLNLHVNQSISYDFLTDKGGFEYNQYQNKLEIGSTYSYSKWLDSPIKYVDYDDNHCVTLYGWTINYKIIKYDNGIFGSHTIEWLNDNDYISDVTMNLSARTSRDNYTHSLLGWESHSGPCSSNLWNATRPVSLSGYTEWLGIYCGDRYTNAKMFQIVDIGSTTTVNINMNNGEITSSINTDWSIFCNSINSGSFNRNNHACAEWNVNNWYTEFNDNENVWESIYIGDIYNFNRVTSYSHQKWNNVTGLNTPMGSEVSKYGTLVPLTQIPDLIQFGEQNKNYVPTEHSDKYELAIGFDKYFSYNQSTLTGQVDFDIIINNLNTGNSLKINGFSGNFPKELTPQMLAAQLATILEITDLLSEDPQKIQMYMNWIIAYTVIEVAIEVALIVLQVYDICMIASLLPIIFVGWILAAYYIYELAMAVFSIITTVNLIVECKSNYENASKMYKNLINLRQECLNLECENYIAFLKYNLLQMISPDYVINNSRDERLIYYYQLVSGEVFNAFRFIIRDLIDRIINNILKKIFGKTIQDALLKRKKLSWISIVLFTASFLLNVAYVVVNEVCFSDYHRFEYSFVDEVRWDHMYSLLPEDMIAILDLWREYLI